MTGRWDARTGVPSWYFGLMCAMAVVRLAEMRRSRRNESMAPGQVAAPRTYPVMVAAHVGLFTLPLLEVGMSRRRCRPRAGWLAILAAANGLRIWSIHSLGTSWNVRAAVPRGLAPVADGPYAYIRHPNYLAVILEFLAVPLAGGAWRSAVGLSTLNALVLWDRIRAEEQLLDASPGYRAAFRGRARFIPGLF